MLARIWHQICKKKKKKKKKNVHKLAKLYIFEWLKVTLQKLNFTKICYMESMKFKQMSQG